MKCPSCQGEWTPPPNVSLSKCPFCQSDIIQTLNEQSGELTPEVILRNLLQVYGIELLQKEQRLSAMISDLFAHDKRTKKMLLLSVKEKVPQQMAAILESEQRELKLLAIKSNLLDDGILHGGAIDQIINFWRSAMEWEEPDDSFEIIWQRGYCGFKNSRGEMITPFKYDYADSFKAGLAKVEIESKWGFIDKSGKEIIPIKYDHARDIIEGLINVTINNKYGFVNKQGIEVIPLIYDHSSECFREGLCGVKLNGKSGFVDVNNYEVIHLQYDGIEGYFNNGFTYAYKDHKCGIIDKTGKEITAFKYDYIYCCGSLKHGPAAAKIGDKCGYIDVNGNEITPFKYDYPHSFYYGFASPKLGDKHILINRLGKEILSFDYDEAWSFSENLVKIKRNEKWGIINKDEILIVPFLFDEVCSIKNGLARVKNDNKFGFIDTRGKIVISIIYEQASEFYLNYSIIQLDGKFGLIGINGEKLVPMKYDSITDYSQDDNHYDYLYAGFHDFENMIEVKEGAKIGFLNTLTFKEIAVNYDQVYCFSDGMAIVQLNGKYGFIDQKGIEIIKVIYDHFTQINLGYEGYFYRGLAEAKLNGKYGFIARNGEVIIPFLYDGIIKNCFEYGFCVVELNKLLVMINIEGDQIYENVYFSENIFLVSKGGLWGFLSIKGKEITPLMYNDAGCFFGDRARVELNGKHGFIDKTGKEIIPLMYDHAGSFISGLAQVELNGKSGYVNILGNWGEINIHKKNS